MRRVPYSCTRRGLAMTTKEAAARLDQQIGWDRANRIARKRSQRSEDGQALARINTNWLKSKAEMDTIAPCVDCGGPWTDEIERHQRAILRGASPAVLVCDTCFKAIRIPEDG